MKFLHFFKMCPLLLTCYYSSGTGFSCTCKGDLIPVQVIPWSECKTLGQLPHAAYTDFYLEMASALLRMSINCLLFSWSPYAKQKTTGPSCCPRTAPSLCTRLSASAMPCRNSILTCMKENWWLLWSKRTPLEAQADGLLTQEVSSLHKYPNNSFPLGY